MQNVLLATIITITTLTRSSFTSNSTDTSNSINGSDQNYISIYDDTDGMLNDTGLDPTIQNPFVPGESSIPSNLITDPSGRSAALKNSSALESDTLTSEAITICTEFPCYEYLKPGIVINMMIAVIRCAFCVFVLLLGIKMQPDFMRTVTMAIYIPIGFRETFYFYIEIAIYISQFQTTNEFAANFINWGNGLGVALDDYVNFDFMIMIIIGLHCCRLCIRDDESIFVFPVRTLSIVLQIVPCFLCLLNLVVPGQQNSNVVLIIIGIVNRLFTLFCFITITVQIAYSSYLVTQELPYDHAASTDMQIRDARSRLVWFLIYLILPYISLIPYFFDAIVWMLQQFNGNGNEINDTTKKDKSFLTNCQIFFDVVKLLVSYYRSTWLIILTCFFLPPYRRAVPLLCCCLPCCPKITVEPLPRKPKEMSTMYKDAI
ncbi:unnamed protein product, partial [Mesorhabditis belari]|uniref:Transmembrane protein n=1 Tax=Mesorhabditis belari TaxID=2138241 RepID=A0AAF3JAC1_9BILA